MMIALSVLAMLGSGCVAARVTTLFLPAMGPRSASSAMGYTTGRLGMESLEGGADGWPMREAREWATGSKLLQTAGLRADVHGRDTEPRCMLCEGYDISISYLMVLTLTLRSIK